MPDMEKVIEGLEHCKKYGTLGGNNCNGYYKYTENLQGIIKANNHRNDCPYGQCKTGCVLTLVADALALLKEQCEQIKTQKENFASLIARLSTQPEIVRCRNCRRYYANGGNCDQILADWFCADGQPKEGEQE